MPENVHFEASWSGKEAAVHREEKTQEKLSATSQILTYAVSFRQNETVKKMYSNA